MTTHRGTFTEPDGILVPIEVGVSRQRRRALMGTGQVVPQPAALTALLDTGAERTCVRPGALVRTGVVLQSFGLANLPAGGGWTPTLLYEVGLVIPHPSGVAARALTVPDLVVEELTLPLPGGVDAVIGRDVLARCRLLYDGPSLQFRLRY